MRDSVQAVRDANAVVEAVKKLQSQVDFDQLSRQVAEATAVLNRYFEEQAAIADAIRRAPFADVVNAAAERARSLTTAISRFDEVYRNAGRDVALQSAAISRYVDQMQRDQDAIAEILRSNPMAEAARLVEQQARTIATAVARVNEVYRSPDVLDVVRDAVTNLTALLANPMFADMPDIVRQVQTDLSPRFGEVTSTKDEQMRRLTLNSATIAIFEVFTKLDTKIDSPEKRLKFWLGVLLLILNLFWFVAKQQAAERMAADVNELEALQREQNRTVELLKSRVLEVESALAGRALPQMRVIKNGVMREEPDSSSARVGRVAPGQSVRLLSAADRWKLVELLTPEGTPTGVYGWVYGRVLRRER
jgi:hypothetical protein